MKSNYYRLSELDKEIERLEKQLAEWANQNADCQRIMKIPGVGVLIATAAIATMGEPTAFRSGREFSAYLGLVPRQTGTGGRVKLLGISKRGGYVSKDAVYPWRQSCNVMHQNTAPEGKRTEKTTSG
ncbi:transposase [Photorhabdus asymbiotica]|uniref:transposase n=1 Tax=Photorhabdus asymbiotica TaxID=291112 RepID=UPI003DA6E5C7